MTATATVTPLFTMPEREQGRGRLHAVVPGDFRGYCRQTTVVGGFVRECKIATASAAELAEHMLTAHGVKPLKVPASIKPSPRSRAPKGEFGFAPKPWAAGDTVEFETKSGGTRTGQVWSDAPPPASVWVIDSETGEAWCVKKPGQYALAYAISMQWGGRA